MRSKTLRFPGAGLVLVALLSAGAAPLGAVPPTPPWLQLEQRAAKEGAAAVRLEYRQQTDAILARLAEPEETPTLESAFRRSLDASWLHEFLRSWARTEAADVRSGRANPRAAEVVAISLVECLEAGHATYAQDVAELGRQRAAASPEKLARLGLPVSPAASFENDRRQALRWVALVAKLGRNEAVLERVFDMSRGGIDSCVTPAEFLAFPHAWQDLLGPEAPESGGVR